MRKPPAPKSAKKVKKRNPWSEDESKSDSELENSELVLPRENKSQRASGEESTAALRTPGGGGTLHSRLLFGSRSFQTQIHL